MASEAKRLFCWSGGGLPGLDIHCGIWKALEAAGIRASANAGTSAGAFVGALYSSGMMQHGAERVLRSLKDSDVIQKRAFWKLRILSAVSICYPDAIHALCNALLPRNFRDLAMPLSVHVTHDLTGNPQELRSGNLPLSVAASMAIAGVWPPVNLEHPNGRTGREYSDGGTTENLPLPDDLAGYDEVWLLVAKRPLAFPERRTIFSRMMYNIDLMSEHAVRETIATARRVHGCVRVIRPLVESPLGTLHFDHDLIDKTADLVAAQLGRISQ